MYASRVLFCCCIALLLGWDGLASLVAGESRAPATTAPVAAVAAAAPVPSAGSSVGNSVAVDTGRYVQLTLSDWTRRGVPPGLPPGVMWLGALDPGRSIDLTVWATSHNLPHSVRIRHHPGVLNISLPMMAQNPNDLQALLLEDELIDPRDTSSIPRAKIAAARKRSDVFRLSINSSVVIQPNATRCVGYLHIRLPISSRGLRSSRMDVVPVHPSLLLSAWAYLQVLRYDWYEEQAAVEASQSELPLEVQLLLANAAAKTGMFAHLRARLPTALMQTFWPELPTMLHDLVTLPQSDVAVLERSFELFNFLVARRRQFNQTLALITRRGVLEVVPTTSDGMLIADDDNAVKEEKTDDDDDDDDDDEDDEADEDGDEDEKDAALTTVPRVSPFPLKPARFHFMGDYTARQHLLFDAVDPLRDAPISSYRPAAPQYSSRGPCVVDFGLVEVGTHRDLILSFMHPQWHAFSAAKAVGNVTLQRSRPDVLRDPQGSAGLLPEADPLAAPVTIEPLPLIREYIAHETSNLYPQSADSYFELTETDLSKILPREDRAPVLAETNNPFTFELLQQPVVSLPSYIRMLPFDPPVDRRGSAPLHALITTSFAPTLEGAFQTVLSIRNNLTRVELLVLRGFATRATLSFVWHPLPAHESVINMLQQRDANGLTGEDHMARSMPASMSCSQGDKICWHQKWLLIRSKLTATWPALQLGALAGGLQIDMPPEVMQPPLSKEYTEGLPAKCINPMEKRHSTPGCPTMPRLRLDVQYWFKHFYNITKPADLAKQFILRPNATQLQLRGPMAPTLLSPRTLMQSGRSRSLMTPLFETFGVVNTGVCSYFIVAVSVGPQVTVQQARTRARMPQLSGTAKAPVANPNYGNYTLPAKHMNVCDYYLLQNSSNAWKTTGNDNETHGFMLHECDQLPMVLRPSHSTWFELSMPLRAELVPELLKQYKREHGVAYPRLFVHLHTTSGIFSLALQAKMPERLWSTLALPPVSDDEAQQYERMMVYDDAEQPRISSALLSGRLVETTPWTKPFAGQITHIGPNSASASWFANWRSWLGMLLYVMLCVITLLFLFDIRYPRRLGRYWASFQLWVVRVRKSLRREWERWATRHLSRWIKVRRTAGLHDDEEEEDEGEEEEGEEEVASPAKRRKGSKKAKKKLAKKAAAVVSSITPQFLRVASNDSATGSPCEGSPSGSPIVTDTEEEKADEGTPRATARLRKKKKQRDVVVLDASKPHAPSPTSSDDAPVLSPSSRLAGKKLPLVFPHMLPTSDPAVHVVTKPSEEEVALAEKARHARGSSDSQQQLLLSFGAAQQKGKEAEQEERKRPPVRPAAASIPNDKTTGLASRRAQGAQPRKGSTDDTSGSSTSSSSSSQSSAGPTSASSATSTPVAGSPVIAKMALANGAGAGAPEEPEEEPWPSEGTQAAGVAASPTGATTPAGAAKSNGHSVAAASSADLGKPEPVVIDARSSTPVRVPADSQGSSPSAAATAAGGSAGRQRGRRPSLNTAAASPVHLLPHPNVATSNTSNTSTTTPRGSQRSPNKAPVSVTAAAAAGQSAQSSAVEPPRAHPRAPLSFQQTQQKPVTVQPGQVPAQLRPPLPSTTAQAPAPQQRPPVAAAKVMEPVAPIGPPRQAPAASPVAAPVHAPLHLPPSSIQQQLSSMHDESLHPHRRIADAIAAAIASGAPPPVHSAYPPMQQQQHQQAPQQNLDSVFSRTAPAYVSATSPTHSGAYGEFTPAQANVFADVAAMGGSSGGANPHALFQAWHAQQHGGHAQQVPPLQTHSSSSSFRPSSLPSPLSQGPVHSPIGERSSSGGSEHMSTLFGFLPDPVHGRSSLPPAQAAFDLPSASSSSFANGSFMQSLLFSGGSGGSLTSAALDVRPSSSASSSLYDATFLRSKEEEEEDLAMLSYFNSHQLRTLATPPMSPAQLQGQTLLPAYMTAHMTQMQQQQQHQQAHTQKEQQDQPQP